MTYLHLPISNTAPMALVHGHVNEWHNIKTKKPQSKHMIASKQTSMQNRDFGSTRTQKRN